MYWDLLWSILINIGSILLLICKGHIRAFKWTVEKNMIDAFLLNLILCLILGTCLDLGATEQVRTHCGPESRQVSLISDFGLPGY